MSVKQLENRLAKLKEKIAKRKEELAELYASLRDLKAQLSEAKTAKKSTAAKGILTGRRPTHTIVVMPTNPEMKWAAWNREETQIIAVGATRDEAKYAAKKAGESEPVLENTTKTRKMFAPFFANGQKVQEKLLTSDGGALTAPEVSKLLGISSDQVEKHRATKHLFGVPTEKDTYVYPRWQFKGGEILPGLRDVLKAFQVHGPWTQMTFFLNGNYRLDGQRPVDVLRRGDIEAVKNAASMYGEHGAA